MTSDRSDRCDGAMCPHGRIGSSMCPHCMGLSRSLVDLESGTLEDRFDSDASAKAEDSPVPSTHVKTGVPELDDALSGGIYPKTLDRVKHTYRDIAASHPSLKRGQVWCRICGRAQGVDSAVCLRHGWPKCCGQTMTIDSPEEQQMREE